MDNGKQPHILNASSNLMGICFVLITALKLTKASVATYADEASMFASVMFMASCVLSYLSMRRVRQAALSETLADYLFLLGIFSLFGAILLFATGIL